MDEITLLQKMAETWRRAADQVAHPDLKRCYGERAASYERLAAAADDPLRAGAARGLT
jgi:hypothetical protein